MHPEGAEVRLAARATLVEARMIKRFFMFQNFSNLAAEKRMVLRFRRDDSTSQVYMESLNYTYTDIQSLDDLCSIEEIGSDA